MADHSEDICGFCGKPGPIRCRILCGGLEKNLPEARSFTLNAKKKSAEGRIRC